MNRYFLFTKLNSLLGKRTYSKLQSAVKYYCTFRKFYNNSYFCKKQDSPQRLIFMVDGKTFHGGISDRLRGVFSAYYYAKENGLDFKVLWTSPFELNLFLEPNKYDWLITPDSISYNKYRCAFRFFNSYCLIDNDKELFFELVNSRKDEIHLYSNITIHEEQYSLFFSELFKPTRLLQIEIDKYLEKIGGKYISISFRFIGLLGDFQDQDSSRMALVEGERQEYIDKCLSAIKRVFEENRNTVKGILVTSDSETFVQKAEEMEHVYVIPGEISHLDLGETSNYYHHLKTFLDFMMIVNAEKCYVFSTGKMYGASRFAKTAALVGGKEIIQISE